MTAPKLTKRQTYWLEHYRHCEQQNMSFGDYSRENNISADAFGHARRTLIKLGAIKSNKNKDSTKKSGFATVKTVQKNPKPLIAHIILPGSITIEVPLALINTFLPTLLNGAQYD